MGHLYIARDEWRTGLDSRTAVPSWGAPNVSELLGDFTFTRPAGPGPGTGGIRLLNYAVLQPGLTGLYLGSDPDRLLTLTDRNAIGTRAGFDPGNVSVQSFIGQWATRDSRPLLTVGPDGKARMRLGDFALAVNADDGTALFQRYLDRLRDAYRLVRTETRAGLRKPDQHRMFLTHWAALFNRAYTDFIPADLPDESPVPLATVVSDDFETDTSANWTAGHGTFTIDAADSGFYLQVTSGESIHNTAMATDDHFAEVYINAQGLSYKGPMIRHHATAGTLTCLSVLKQEGAGAVVQYFEWSAGSPSQNGANETDTFSAGDAYKGGIDTGGTWQFYKNGSAVGSGRTLSGATWDGLTSIGIQANNNATFQGISFNADETAVAFNAALMQARLVGTLQPMMVPTGVVGY